MNKKRNKWNLLLASMWFVAGICTLISGPTRLTYGLCCISLIMNHVVTYICGDANYNEGFYDGAVDAVDRCSKALDEVCNKRKRELEDDNSAL